MNDVEDRLRALCKAATDPLPEQGPGLDAVTRSYIRTTPDARTSTLRLATRGVVLLGAAAAVVGAINIVGHREPSRIVGSAAGNDKIPAPVVTLPPAANLSAAPITVPAGSELSYFRFLPDLDVAFRDAPGEQTVRGSSAELCWRTPAGTGCIPDDFTSPSVGLIPSTGAAILLLRPGLIPIVPAPQDPSAPKLQLGPDPIKVTISLSDGSTVDVPVAKGKDLGLGYSRVLLPDGLTVTAAKSS
jgi:hypothetical protein